MENNPSNFWNQILIRTFLVPGQHSLFLVTNDALWIQDLTGGDVRRIAPFPGSAWTATVSVVDGEPTVFIICTDYEIRSISITGTVSNVPTPWLLFDVPLSIAANNSDLFVHTFPSRQVYQIALDTKAVKASALWSGTGTLRCATDTELVFASRTDLRQDVWVHKFKSTIKSFGSSAPVWRRFITDQMEIYKGYLVVGIERGVLACVHCATQSALTIPVPQMRGEVVFPAIKPDGTLMACSMASKQDRALPRCVPVSAVGLFQRPITFRPTKVQMAWISPFDRLIIRQLLFVAMYLRRIENNSTLSPLTDDLWFLICNFYRFGSAGGGMRVSTFRSICI